MDEEICDEFVESVNGTHIQNKELEFSLNQGSLGVLQSNEMVTPGVYDYPESSKDPFLDTSDAKNLDRIGSSENVNASPHCMTDAGVMVEELTLRNYEGKNLTIVGVQARERMKNLQNHKQHLLQRDGGSEFSHLHGRIAHNNKTQVTTSDWEDGDDSFFSRFIDQDQQEENHDVMMDNPVSNDDKFTSGDLLHPSGGIRTKILLKSGFSEYFMKSTLGGKGVIYKAPAHRKPVSEMGNQDCSVYGISGVRSSDAPLSLTLPPVSPVVHNVSESLACHSSKISANGVSLREWLEALQNKSNKVQSFGIFRQVLNIVNFSHSQDVALQELRPSRFKLLESSDIIYLGSPACAKSTENITGQWVFQPNHQNEKRSIQQSMHSLDSYSGKKPKLNESTKFTQRWPQFPTRSGNISALKSISKFDSGGLVHPGNCADKVQNLNHESKSLGFSQTSLSFMLEEKWYNSPELSNEMNCTLASNIYSLGILLFELICRFDSGRSRAAAMFDLQHRILPPTFLSENPKEAGFCLWLLHPIPSLRPTTREILQSEFISGIQESSRVESLSSIDNEDGESELLLYFLSSLYEKKQKDASNLVEQIHCIESDIQEVLKRQPKNSRVLSSPVEDPTAACETGYHEVDPSLQMSLTNDKETRLTSNLRKLESAYFSTRFNIQVADNNVSIRRDGELLKSRDNMYAIGKDYNTFNTADCLGGFFDGLCKYARYKNFMVRGVLRNGNSSTSVICSLSFDCDEDYLAAGLVSKKIKIFEFQALLSSDVDVHYPVVEMANKSKLSCVCWNSYIRNYIASTDYEGVVKLWDAGTGQSFSRFIEHSQRAWCVDFSRVDPMKLASGSDDHLVKVWSISEKNSCCTIRNNANVCCVQFSANSAHLLAFTSADYKTYCYDLRNASTPWCTLVGHEKAVSYAKFLDASTLVSASTDNSIKIWDLNKTSSNSPSRDACVLTLRGHTNEKNFVGLSVLDGYIACGSETDEVFAYYKSLPMPIATHKFGSVDPITEKETEDINGQFVSSVCWRQKSKMVVAANSSGCIKLLQMV